MARAGRKVEDTPPSPGLEEGHAVEPPDGIAHAQSAVKIHEVDAIAQQHVLAVIDHLARSGMLVRRSPSTQIAPLLQQSNLVAGLRQCARGRQTCQSTAHYSYVQAHTPCASVLKRPHPNMLSFSYAGTPIRAEKTSKLRCSMWRNKR
jgi:hypothetical protein